jgi:hypothetical protein
MSQQNQHGNTPFHKFTRLFPDLPPLDTSSDDLRILANLMLDNNIRLPVGDSKLYAGLTYLGQFIDHDLSREKRTILSNQGIIDIDKLKNERTSWFDLDSCFGENIGGLATLDEINTVAQNAFDNKLDSTYAVFKFVANKNIQGIASGLILPFAKSIGRTIVNPPFVLPPEENKPVKITQSQLRGRALTKTINDSLRYTQQEALDVLAQVELEINQALTSIPPIVNIFDFIDVDILE